jgi:predicted nucleic acid-binding protein
MIPGNPILVDSSFYITLLQAKADPLAWLESSSGLYDYDFATCGIIWMEVLRGRSDPRLRDRFECFFQTAVFINQSPATWQRIARLTWELDRKGIVLPATDLAIAACALEHDVPLLTFDKHFRSIPGVIAIDSLPS